MFYNKYHLTNSNNMAYEHKMIGVAVVIGLLASTLLSIQLYHLVETENHNNRTKPFYGKTAYVFEVTRHGARAPLLNADKFSVAS